MTQDVDHEDQRVPRVPAEPRPPEQAPPSVGYLVMGGVFLLASAPGWIALVLGTLFASRNPYLLMAFLGTPVGVLFVVLGRRRTSNSQSRIASRFAILSLAFLVMALGSELAVWAGFKPMVTSAGFCFMAASYLALATLVFLVRALARKGGGS
jgi:hypothetical protein